MAPDPAPEAEAPAGGRGRLAGRVALVTGAARGIGRAIAAAYAAEGAVLALADLDADGAAAAARALGDGAVALPVDLAVPAQASAVVERAVAALGRIDVLVNNAGILRLGRVGDIAVEEWDLVFAVNARAVFLTTQAAAPHMARQGGGRVVNVASMAGKTGAAGQSHYAASKAAVIDFTRSAAAELGPSGVTVNCICPGFVLTEMGAATRTPELVAEWTARSPLGRLGEPADVAKMAVFLASDDASYCTGQAFNVTGGMVMH